MSRARPAFGAPYTPPPRRTGLIIGLVGAAAAVVLVIVGVGYAALSRVEPRGTAAEPSNVDPGRTVTCSYSDSPSHADSVRQSVAETRIQLAAQRLRLASSTAVDRAVIEQEAPDGPLPTSLPHSSPWHPVRATAENGS